MIKQRLSNTLNKRQQNFNLKFKQNTWEDSNLLNLIDKFLINKKGYVYKEPQKKEPVVLLLSGGIDSVVAWKLLLKKKYIVYPLYITEKKSLFKKISNYKHKLDNSNKEKESIQFFAKLFQSQHNKYFIKPVFWEIETERKYTDKLFLNPQKKLHSKQLLKILFELNQKKFSYKDRFSNPYHLYITAFHFAKYLELTQNISINHIFTGTTSGDGESQASQSLTAIRLITLLYNLGLNEYSYSLSSPFYERETANFYSKANIIKIGSKLKLPLEKTWSCYHGGKLQCGTNCLTCGYRIQNFRLAKVVDKTKYLKSLPE